MDKFVEGLAAFQMIEERLNRHPRADKDRRSAEDVWIAVDDFVESHHMNRSIASPEMFPAYDTARTYMLVPVSLSMVPSHESIPRLDVSA